MSEYTLHCFAQSGNAFKCALMLNLNKADWEPAFVDFMNGATRTPEYRETINERGEVPVRDHDGSKLTQSGVILDYLVGQFGTFGWSDDNERREILRWILWDNHKLTSYVATLRFMVAFMKTGETPVTEFLRGRLGGSFAILDKHLGGSDFVVGDKPTIADISICGYLYWPHEIGVSWSDYPAIEAWLGRIKSLDGWVHPYELMPGHPLPE